MVKFMRHFTSFMIVLAFSLLFPCHIALAVDNLEITAHSAILMDAHTGQILYEKNAFNPVPPASTTKIATALLALEMGDLQSVVTVSERAARVGESSMHLTAGEQLTLEQLLTGALVRSGNDACVAIAEHLAGSEDLFVQLVNNRLNFLGAESTNFINTNGLPVRGHVTSAHDLALITRYALANPTFGKLVGTRYAVIHGPHQWTHELTNTNKLLWSYPGTTGVKTGTTNEAGQCLVASATRDGRCLIAVVLHSSNRYQDSIKILEYGFNSFNPVTVIEKGEIIKRITVTEGDINRLPLVADRSVVFLRHQGEDLHLEKKFVCKPSMTAPIRAGSKLGQVLVFNEGKVVGYANLVTETSVKNNSSSIPFASITLLNRLISSKK